MRLKVDEERALGSKQCRDLLMDSASDPAQPSVFVRGDPFLAADLIVVVFAMFRPQCHCRYHVSRDSHHCHHRCVVEMLLLLSVYLQSFSFYVYIYI